MKNIIKSTLCLCLMLPPAGKSQDLHLPPPFPRPDMRMSSSPGERSRFQPGTPTVFTELRTNRVALVEQVTVTSNLIFRTIWYETNGAQQYFDEVKSSNVVSRTTNVVEAPSL